MRSYGLGMLFLISVITFFFFSLPYTEDYFRNAKERRTGLVKPETYSSELETVLGSDIKHTNAFDECLAIFSFEKYRFKMSGKDDKRDGAWKKVKESFKHNFLGATEPYKKISNLYRSLLVKSFRKFRTKNFILTNASERHTIKHIMLKNQPKFSYKLSELSVLEMTGGTLPSAPCRLKYRYDPSELTQALAGAAEANNGSLEITFLGDSKLRDLFLTLLIETKYLNYTVYCNNTSTSLAGVLEDLVQDKHLWTTRKAVANQVPGLIITHVFESFSFGAMKNFYKSASVGLLRDWVRGRTKAPDVLIIGYGQWMFYLMMLLKELPLTVLGSLDYLLEVDNLVTSLVRKLPKKTLVLFLAQTRQRPHARTEYNVKYDVNSVGNTEWRDSILRQRLAANDRRGYLSQNPIAHPEKNLGLSSAGNSSSIYSNPSNFHALYGPKSQRRFTAYESSRAAFENSNREFDGKFIAYLPPHLLPNETIINDQKTKDARTPRLENLRRLINSKEHNNEDWPQILFWDSSLPLNLARIRDCETLYKHDPQTANAIPFFLGRKMRAFKYESLLQRLKASDRPAVTRHDVNKQNPSESKTLAEGGIEITSTVENLLGSLENISSGVKLKGFRPRTNASPSDEEVMAPAQVFNSRNVKNYKKQSMDDSYFNDFVTAYSSPELNCLDDLHAGVSTNQIEAFQLLNFLVNRHLQAEDNMYCCQ